MCFQYQRIKFDRKFGKIYSPNLSLKHIEGEEGSIYALDTWSYHRGNEKLKNNFNTNDFEIISMGMSGDYPIAIECGSNMIRVGSAIFGERK